MWAYERRGLMVLDKTNDVGEPIRDIQTGMGVALHWTTLLWLTVDGRWMISRCRESEGFNVDIHGRDDRGN